MKKLIIMGLICFALLFGCTGNQTGTDPLMKPADTTKPADTFKPVDTTKPVDTAKPSDTGDAIPKTLSATEVATNFFNNGKVASWKVTYEFVSGSQSYVMVQYKRGGSDMRTDLSMQGTESRVYFLSDILYSCNKQGETWVCYSMAGFESEDTFSKAVATLPRYMITELPSMQLAGVDAKCYNLKDADGLEMDYCFSPEGVPLYIRTGATSQLPEVVVKATSYSAQVTDADFQLPAEPQNMEDLY
ncbi:MAG: hypothetical protein ABII22_01350 [Candidatus Micrarchaeota archaeon]